MSKIIKFKIIENINENKFPKEMLFSDIEDSPSKVLS